MPAPSAIDNLDPDQRQALERELIRRNFKDYAGLVAWAAEYGLEISRSSAHRYGQKIQRKLNAVKASTDAARLIAEAAPDDADLRSAAVISMVQSELFEVLLNLQEAEATDDPQQRVELMAKAARGVADLSRASVGQKKWQQQVAVKFGAKLDQLEAKAAAGPGKLDAATLRAVRQEVYGLFE